MRETGRRGGGADGQALGLLRKAEKGGLAVPCKELEMLLDSELWLSWSHTEVSPLKALTRPAERRQTSWTWFTSPFPRQA